MIYKTFHLNTKSQILFTSSDEINAKATWAFINKAKCRNPGDDAHNGDFCTARTLIQAGPFFSDGCVQMNDICLLISSCPGIGLENAWI